MPLFPALLGFFVYAGASGCGGDVLAVVEGLEAASEFFVEGGKLGGPGFIVLFEQAEGFPDYFARGGIAARLYFGCP